MCTFCGCGDSKVEGHSHDHDHAHDHDHVHDHVTAKAAAVTLAAGTAVVADPEHLDHYASFEEYRQAKLNVFRFQRPGDQAVVEGLFRIIEDLKSQGVAIVYISHKLEELLQVGGRRELRVDGPPAPHHALGQVGVEGGVRPLVRLHRDHVQMGEEHQGPASPAAGQAGHQAGAAGSRLHDPGLDPLAARTANVKRAIVAELPEADVLIHKDPVSLGDERRTPKPS